MAGIAVLIGLAAPSAAHAQQSEVVSLLQELVRVNTSNPPGNEAQVAELLAPRLQALGFEVEIVQTPTAGTDAVPWRERGIPVYGVYPYPISRAELVRMHGNDERVPIPRLEQGTEWITRVLRDVAAQ